MKLISDTHFGHNNIIKYCNRPYPSSKEMDEDLVKIWNQNIEPNEIVYHLGDFRKGKPEYLASIIKRLNGRIHLIRGNHDVSGWGMTDQVLDLFETVETYKEIKFNKKFIVLFHYPIESWNGSYHGSFHFHGHCHGSLQHVIKNRFDVGIDVIKKPLDLEAFLDDTRSHLIKRKIEE